MRVYQYKCDNDKEFIFQFTARIYMVVKMKMNVVLDQAIQKNPYDSEVLTLCLFEFYKQACVTKEEETLFTINDIKESFEVDEMLLIYTTLVLERGAKNSKKFKKDGLN